MRSLALGLALMLVLSACSSDPSEEKLASAFVAANPSATQAEANCIVARLSDEIGGSELERQLSEDGDPSADFAIIQMDAMLSCGMADQIEASLVESFASANSVDEETSRCAVSALTEQLGAGELLAQVRMPVASAEFVERQFRVLFFCGETDAVEATLRAQLVQQGTDPDAAPCVALELTQTMNDADLTVLLTDTITDEFYAKFFAAMSVCGAVNG